MCVFKQQRGFKCLLNRVAADSLDCLRNSTLRVTTEVRNDRVVDRAYPAQMCRMMVDERRYLPASLAMTNIRHTLFHGQN